MSYIFTFDASACSGCKACQVACKDRNGLPAGLLWRRVIEVAGGEWKATDTTWENSVFAYSLTLACNHCAYPKCAGVCPTDAYNVRPDGIVLIDTSKCMGCRYCAWACPYAAPQYDQAHGVVTKCDFCYDSLDAGLPPTCVAACPLRVLDYGNSEELKLPKGGQNLWELPASEHPYPLPGYSRTEPRLTIKPHPGMYIPLDKTVSNREEIHPESTAKKNYRITAVEELPLVVFTLLSQMAVGMAVCGLGLYPFPRQVLLAIGILLGIGGLISFLHLGRKHNAWRSIVHLRKSWLSREVLMAGLFEIAWAITVTLEIVQGVHLTPWLMAVPGIGLIYCMGRVYLLRSVLSWNTWRTHAAFVLSAAILGVLGVRLGAAFPGWSVIIALALVAEMGMIISIQPVFTSTAGRLRLAMLGLAMTLTLLAAIFPQANKLELIIPLFIIALASEAIGRWQFYAGRVPFLAGSN